MPIVLFQLLAYRNFIVRSVKNDFRMRFARSKLAGFWVVIQPLVQVAIFALVLSNLLSARLVGVEGKYAYTVHLLAGMVVWTLFSDSLSKTAISFLEHASVIKKISFPRICPPAIGIGIALANAAILLTLSLLFIGPAYGISFAVVWWLFPILVLTAALGAGIGLGVGTLNVFMRDVWQVVSVVLQFLYWFTPIVYPMGALTPDLASMVQKNPLTSLVLAAQDVLVRGAAPNVESMFLPFALAVLMGALGFFIFRRAAPDMADAL